VLDESCGSGTFLIKSQEVFVNYCEKYNELVDQISNKISERSRKLIQEGRHRDSWYLQSIFPEPLRNYEAKILYNCIYGVDIDVAAAEIAVVNLILQILRKGEKLPMIIE
jgi:hypothetical protein